MARDLLGNIGTLREMASDLDITGNTSEQALLLAIIDTLDELAETIGYGMDPTFEQPSVGALFTKCPACGETISLDISTIDEIESLVCTYCHEEIAVATVACNA